MSGQNPSCAGPGLQEALPARRCGTTTPTRTGGRFTSPKRNQNAHQRLTAGSAPAGGDGWIALDGLPTDTGRAVAMTTARFGNLTSAAADVRLPA